MASKHCPLTDPHRAREAHLCNKDGASFNLAVVPHLHEVIDSRMRADGCVAQGAPIYTSQRTDVGAITDTYPADLRNRCSNPLIIGLEVAKTTSPNNTPRLDPDPIAQNSSRQEPHAGSDATSPTQLDPSADVGLCSHMAVIAKKSAPLNNYKGTQTGVLSNIGTRIDHSAGVDPKGPCGWMKVVGKAHKGTPWVLDP